MKLLTTNTKLEKIPGVEQKYLVRGMSLAPAHASGHNVCAWAGACVAACVLWFAGRTVMKNVRAAMIARTRLFFDDRVAFIAKLRRELTALLAAADRAGAVAVVRLNTASDIVWERVAPEVFAEFPRITFYDYTKAPAKRRATLPANYHLSHSIHEGTTFAEVCDAFNAGRNVVAVFDSLYHPQQGKFGALPARVIFRGPAGETLDVETVNGDVQDVRIPELDGRRRCVVLAGKGGAVRVAEARAAGFVRQSPVEGIVAGDASRLDGVAVVTLL
jgi:hypothetical protein